MQLLLRFPKLKATIKCYSQKVEAVLMAGSTIKEEKDGERNELMKFEFLQWPLKFIEAGNDRIVAVVSKELKDRRVMVFLNKQLVHTCKRKCGNWHSLTVEGNKAYFLSEEKGPYQETIVELDLGTFEEKALNFDASAICGVPGNGDFLAVSDLGHLRSSKQTLQLKEVFPKMKECFWRAVCSLDLYALVAGFSKFDPLTGSELPKKTNFFLLVKLTNLTIPNRDHPLSLEWIGKSTLSAF